MGLISISGTRQVREIHFNELRSAICDLLVELFTLCGKYQDEDKIKIFGNALANDLPPRYPGLTLADLQVIFKNAITGQYGEVKAIDLPTLHKWVRKWQEGRPGFERALSEGLAGFHTSGSVHVNWSKECYKAYRTYLQKGLKVSDISHWLYDRMQIDGLIEMEAYRALIGKAAQYLVEEPDEMSQTQREIAKRMVVINVFELKKRQGIDELYRMHKDDV